MSGKDRVVVNERMRTRGQDGSTSARYGRRLIVFLPYKDLKRNKSVVSTGSSPENLIRGITRHVTI